MVLNSSTRNAHFVHFISFYSLQELLQFLINLYLGFEAKQLCSKGTNLLTKKTPKVVIKCIPQWYIVNGL